MKTGILDVKTSKLSYRLFGELSSQFVIIETAMGACSAEWWHLAEKWSDKFCILSYDRAGYGSSSSSSLSRTPFNIAHELNELLNMLGIRKKAVMIGHSIGGLYAQQFARLFPDRVHSILLLDPVSANNQTLKEQLNKREYYQSGIDKGGNLKLGLIITSLKLGFLLTPLLRKAPPFYYFHSFSKEAENAILRNQTQRKLYESTIAEYKCLESEEEIGNLKDKTNFPDVPLYLICHDPETMIAEIEHYGGTDKAIAAKIDELWVSLMKEYLHFSGNSVYKQARNSGHLIHLSDPDVIWEALCSLN